MSTDPMSSGGKVDLDRAAAESAKLIEEAVAEEIEWEQDDLFAPITSEEVLEAREELGNKAGALSIKKHIRAARKRGRPKNAKNRANADFQKYLLQFGPNPAVVMMQILSETEEEMVERSQQVDSPKQRLTWAAARAFRLRAAEGTRKIFVGDQPVQVDHTITGVKIVNQFGGAPGAAGKTIDQRPKVMPNRDDQAEGGK